MSLKSNILASNSRAEAEANLQIALAHPNIRPQNRRRCLTAFRSVEARFPQVEVTPEPITATKPKRVRKAPARKSASKLVTVS